MAFDGIAVSTIVNELNQKLVNARMVKIYQPERHTVLFHLRTLGQNQSLLISADPTASRIHTSTETFVNPSNPPAFCMLLRKYLEPSRLMRIKQYQLERIIILEFECFDSEHGSNQKKLIFELMGRNSNLIFVDQNNLILDAIFNNDKEHERPIFPGETYRLPPVKLKINPRTTTLQDFEQEMRLLPALTPVYQGLFQLYQGLSPQTAREICHRSEIDPDLLKQDLDLASLATLWQSFSDLITKPQIPVMVKAKKLDFFAYQITNATSQKEFASLDELLDIFYTSRINNERIRQSTNGLKRIISTHLKRAKRTEKIHRKTLEQAADAHLLQKQGELILANIHRIKQGDALLIAEDYYEPEHPEIKIELNPRFSPSENAQQYFKRYTKAKRSQKVIKVQLRKTIQQRQYLEAVLLQLDQAEDLATVTEIQAELIAEGYFKPRSKQKKQEKIVQPTNYQLYLATDGTEILLGRNNRQNDFLTFKTARESDTWLHAQNIPGSHVIIRGHPISDQALLEAATLAAYYSKSRTSPKVAIDYTQRKYVRKPRQAKPGFVTYSEHKTIIVDPTKKENLPKRKV